MAYNTWPTFAGRGWNIKKRPITRTIIETADGGQEFRLSRFQSPLYEFDIEIPYLTQADYATLQRFFAQQGGPFTPFLFYPDNEAAAATPFFTGDGVTTQATLLMPDGSPALFANSGATPTVTAIHQTDWQGRLALSNQPRTNNFLHSQDFGNSAWTTSNASETLAQPSPDGGATACLVTAVAGAQTAQISEDVTTGVVAGQQVFLTLFVKSGAQTKIAIQVNQRDASHNNLAAWFIVYDLAAGTFGTPSSLVAGSPPPNSWAATAGGNGYVRIQIAFTAVTGCTQYTAYFGPTASLTSRNANAGDGVYVDRVSSGTAVGAYIPTTTAAVTVTDYTQAGAQITFGQVPAVGAVEDWDGAYAYLVRFKDDQIEMTQTMSQIYEATTVTLRSVR